MKSIRKVQTRYGHGAKMSEEEEENFFLAYENT